MPNSSKSIPIETERLSIENMHGKKTLDGNNGHALVTEISCVTEKFLSDDPVMWPSQLSNNDV